MAVSERNRKGRSIEGSKNEEEGKAIKPKGEERERERRRRRQK